MRILGSSFGSYLEGYLGIHLLFLQATQAVKIKFEIDKKSSSNKKCRSTGSNAAKIVVLSSYLLVLIVPTL